jgi:epoxyqueuosine reductase
MLSADRLRSLARTAGFHRAGLARVRPLDSAPLDRWIAAGYVADMDWLARRRDERLDPTRLVASAKTALVLAVGFARGEPGVVARYARGRDYHYVLRDRLKRLRKAVLADHPGLPTYGSVDANPVMEKVWAEEAGIGFMGKHGLIIAPGLGSNLLLAVLFLGDEADAYDAPLPRQCGDCTLCLSACPTGALVSPAVVDARKCLSYQTIENEGPVPESIRPAFRHTLFGCDLCQTCCPWNATRERVDEPGLAERPLAKLNARDFAALTPEAYANLIPGSALARAGYHGLRRNALLALGASLQLDAIELVRSLTADPEERVRDAASWALEQLEQEQARQMR